MFEKRPAEQPIEILRFFYAEVTKKGGELYKKSLLNCICEGIARHLKKERNIDVIEDPVYESANDVFRAQLIELIRQGKGATEHKQLVEGKELQKLYDSFDISTPRRFQQKVWVDIMLYLTRRGRENLRQMTKSTFEIKVDAAGKRFVTKCDTPLPPQSLIGRAKAILAWQNAHKLIKMREQKYEKIYPKYVFPLFKFLV